VPDDREATVSVVIPCYSLERWPMLVTAVESVMKQDPCPAEIVVSVDHNDELLRRVREQWPDVTAVANRFAAGASGTRNTGVLRTDTPFVALLDDDAQARPGWLAGLLAPFAEPSVVGTGGTIVPRWQRERPSWFPDELLWAVVGTRDGVDAPTTVRNVWSASMAVRRRAFDAAGGFRVGFGKRGTRPRPEDTDLCLRMAARVRGHWVYVPDAIVDHCVPPDRVELPSLIGRCYQEGRGKVELARAFRGATVLDLERDYVFRLVPAAVLREVAAALRGRGMAHAARAAALLVGILSAAVGSAVELVHLRRARLTMSNPGSVSGPPILVDDEAPADAAVAGGRHRAAARPG